ncbi:MAG: amino acid permease [Verrucomicrobia bacterium]|nr:amino acid permease [Verrucomicrobiota bacterium]
MGLISATALVVANMIGTGVFTTSGFLLADLGSRWTVLAVWLVGGIQAALGALCYGALARHIPQSGGEYVFLSKTLHPAAGYLAGWISLLVGFSAPVAAAAFAFGQYSRPWLWGCSPQVSGTVLVLLFAALHAANVRRGANVQNVAVLMKVSFILLFVCFAAFLLSPSAQPATKAFSPSAFGLSLVWVSFSYSGWNAAVYIGGEVENPERNLPASLLLGTGIVALLYLSLNAVFLLSAPLEVLAGKLEIGRIAGQAIGGPALGEAVSAVVALGLISSVSAMVMAGPRVYAKMANDGYLPRWLGTTGGPPRSAIAVQAALALAFLWTSSYDGLLTYLGFTLGLSTAMTVIGLIKLKLREGAEIRVPGWPIVPGLFVLGVLAMTTASAFRRPMESAIGLATLVAGWVSWRLTKNMRHRDDLSEGVADPGGSASG